MGGPAVEWGAASWAVVPAEMDTRRLTSSSVLFRTQLNWGCAHQTAHLEWHGRCSVGRHRSQISDSVPWAWEGFPVYSPFILFFSSELETEPRVLSVHALQAISHCPALSALHIFRRPYHVAQVSLGLWSSCFWILSAGIIGVCYLVQLRLSYVFLT